MAQMADWLCARHCGVVAYTLRWRHDATRSRSAGEGGELTVRTASPTRDMATIDELVAALDPYIRWYSEARIKISLGS